MSSVLSEYPETLPAPMVGVVTLTERRKISTIGKIRNTRNVQRDRHGTRTVSFVYTPAQAAIFREWWKEWEQLGGGWFAANWPLPWQRGSNVFRFIDPPDWQLVGGGLNGQGYYSVRATVEIRGRGMLPTVEVMYLTSTPYPIEALDAISMSVGAVLSDRVVIKNLDISPEGLDFSNKLQIFDRNTIKDTSIADALQMSVNAGIYARLPQQLLYYPNEALGISLAITMSARTPIVRHTIVPEALQISLGVTIYAA